MNSRVQPDVAHLARRQHLDLRLRHAEPADGAATDLGVSWESVEQDPQINVATGTAYLGYRIGRSHGNVGAGLAGYGTGSSYADAILNCEKCLNQNANEPCDVKTKRCLEPLHPRRPPKPRHRRRRARP
jgi:hypothetical protein